MIFTKALLSDLNFVFLIKFVLENKTEMKGNAIIFKLADWAGFKTHSSLVFSFCCSRSWIRICRPRNRADLRKNIERKLQLFGFRFHEILSKYYIIATHVPRKWEVEEATNNIEIVFEKIWKSNREFRIDKFKDEVNQLVNNEGNF